MDTGLGMLFGFYGGIKQVGERMKNLPEGGHRLAQIPLLIGANLCFGLLELGIGSGDKYLGGLL